MYIGILMLLKLLNAKFKTDVLGTINRPFIQQRHLQLIHVVNYCLFNEIRIFMSARFLFAINS